MLPTVIKELILEYTGTAFRVYDKSLKLSFSACYTDIESKVTSGLWYYHLTPFVPTLEYLSGALILHHQDLDPTTLLIPHKMVYRDFVTFFSEMSITSGTGSQITSFKLDIAKDFTCYPRYAHTNPNGQFVIIPLSSYSSKGCDFVYNLKKYIEDKIRSLEREHKIHSPSVYITHYYPDFVPSGIASYFPCDTTGFNDKKDIIISSEDDEVILYGENKEGERLRRVIDVNQGTTVMRNIYSYIRVLDILYTGDIRTIPWILPLQQRIMIDPCIKGKEDYEIISEREYRYKVILSK